MKLIKNLLNLMIIMLLVTAPLSYVNASELLKAIKANDIKGVEALVKDKKQLNLLLSDENGNKRTPLMDASEFGYSDIVRLLIRYGADPNIAPNDGPSALLLASNRGHLVVVELLVENGANINATNNWGATPLINAASNGHTDVVKFLLQHGANPNAKLQTPFDVEGRTALMMAAAQGDKTTVDVIIKTSPIIDIDERNKAYSILKEAEGNREYISGTVLEVSSDFLRVKMMNSIYKFPIQQQTKIVDNQGLSIAINQFKKGDAVAVTYNRDNVIEIIKGGWTVTIEPLQK